MNLEDPVKLGEFFGEEFEKSREQIRQILKEHLTTPVNIGVTGDRGSGKSTLIRAFTGIFPPDPRAARTDSIHRTRYPTPYLDSNIENIVFWDCPGLGDIEPGTEENYFDKISKLDNQEENEKIKERLPNFVIPERVSYDCFLICGDNGFNQQEADLAKIFSKQNLNCYFVKTKFDNYLMKAEQNNGAQLTVEQVKAEINEIKQNVVESLKNRFDLTISRERIFILSAMVNTVKSIDNRRFYDFPLLHRIIISSMMTEQKKNSLIIPKKMNLEEPIRDSTVQLGEFLGQTFQNSREQIQKKLNEHLTTPVNIGVPGVRGSGKSTLIRAITGIFPPDPRAAATDSIHQTRYPTPYLHPNNENIVFWDCPGLGGMEPGKSTNAFDLTKENYFDKISKLDNQEENKKIKERLPNFVIPERVSYDCFLICGDNGFNQQEADLAKIFSKQNLNCYFVKTKFDNDITNAEQNYGALLTIEQVEAEINKIKQNVVEILENRFGLTNSRERIFVISAMVNTVRKIDNRLLYDFPLLQRIIISNMMTEEKKHSLIMAFLPLVKEDVLIKCETLRKRINLISIYSCFGCLVPIPGTSFAIDLTLIFNELTIYVRSLNISKKHIEDIANSFGIKYDAIEQKILNNHQLFKTVVEINEVPFIKTALINFLSNDLIANTVEEALTFVPYLGPVAGLVISFATTQVSLRKILNEFETTIIEVVEYCAKNKKI